jgi:catechol 2,3-dioxygenase-like lactoylglutathione lyase family enzyme
MAGLGDSMVAAVLRAEDLARAGRFYSEVLGLTRGNSSPAGDMFTAGKGTAVMIYERPGMAAPENTTLGFAVEADRFDGLVSELRGKGVVFEEYDIPEIGLKTVDGVAIVDEIKTAWFKDTEGNIVSIAVM